MVIGAGIIGNLWVCMLHHNGYREVTVSEPSQGRRDILANLGKNLFTILSFTTYNTIINNS